MVPRLYLYLQAVRSTEIPHGPTKFIAFSASTLGPLFFNGFARDPTNVGLV